MGTELMRDRVLIVDDIEINRLILREILSTDYDIVEAEDGDEAVEMVLGGETRPDIVLLDIMMPGLNGFEVLEIIMKDPVAQKIPVLFITAADASTTESRGLKEGAVDYISKPFVADVVKARVDNHIQLMHYRNDLERLVEKKTSDLMKTHEQMLETMANIIEYRSLESGLHIKRTRQLAKIMIDAMLLDPEYHRELIDTQYDSIVKASVMHDIGKVGIPDDVLLKPGKLTPEEFDVIKTHTTIGSNVIMDISSSLTDDAMYLKHCADICLYHHERWDGTGYPQGLKGYEIPLSARVLSIVDVYDALVTERCYKKAIPHEEALKIIEEGAGTQFDPKLVGIFLEQGDKFKDLELNFSDGEI